VPEEPRRPIARRAFDGLAADYDRPGDEKPASAHPERHEYERTRPNFRCLAFRLPD
jgi:hypothetical protein